MRHGVEDEVVEAAVGAGDGFAGADELAAGDVAGEGLVDEDADGVDVGAVVDGGAGDEEFGGGVVGGAHGEGGVFVVRGAEWVVDFGEAEVGDFDLVVGGDEDVARFDIEVVDVVGVGVVEGAADL